MDNNYSVFEFIYPRSNDKLSELNNKELKEFLTKLDLFMLEYREGLIGCDDNSFGLEFECDNITESITDEKISRLNLRGHWKTVSEPTLDDGIEVCSPILKDEKRTWEDVFKLCVYLDSKTKSLKKAASHVHVGAQVLKSNEAFINLLELYSTYENIIFRFCFGEDLIGREELAKYAKPISSDCWNKASIIRRFNLSYREIAELIRASKYTSLNFANLSKNENIFKKGNTLEFRAANGTLNPIIWQNIVNLCLNIVNSSNKVDRDIIEKRHKMIEKYAGDLGVYDEIFLDQALEFADLIFKNNIDKVYFLKQYLKGFDLANDKKKTTSSFTRILTKSHEV